MDPVGKFFDPGLNREKRIRYETALGQIKCLKQIKKN